MHPGGWGFNIHELKSEIGRKADGHEIHSLRSNVSSLESAVRELRAEVDGLRSQLYTLEEKARLVEFPLG